MPILKQDLSTRLHGSQLSNLFRETVGSTFHPWGVARQNLLVTRAMVALIASANEMDSKKTGLAVNALHTPSRLFGKSSPYEYCLHSPLHYYAAASETLNRISTIAGYQIELPQKFLEAEGHAVRSIRPASREELRDTFGTLRLRLW